MVEYRVLLLASVLVLVPVHAGMVEEASDGMVSYQFDAGTHHDAPDGCGDAHANWSLPLGGTIGGMLVAGDDEVDAYVLDLPASAVGERVTVHVSPGPGSGDLGVEVWAPGCMGDVFDAANLPFPLPQPPTPSSGQTTHALHNLNGTWTCNASEWHFVVNGLGGGTAPASIHAAWTDGTETDLPLVQANQGTAHFTATSPLGAALKGAWVNMPTGWSGNFLLSHGPCNLPDGGAVYGDEPFALLGLLEFTPVRSGHHVVLVTYSPPEPSAPTSIPASCHYCFGPVADVIRSLNYDLSSFQA
jgi:hypothetical protein